ncbi:MAG: hypothetical protein ACFFA8_01005 [Promethearchaeota archaeon]
MSELQETDKAMRVIGIIGGVIAFIEAILQFIGMGYGWSFGILSAVIGLLCALAAIFLGIKPIHYTPFILAALGVVLIIFACLIGGIFVLLAAFIGLIS